MDLVKESFIKVKKDIEQLNLEIYNLKKEKLLLIEDLNILKLKLIDLCNVFSTLHDELKELKTELKRKELATTIPTNKIYFPTIQQENTANDSFFKPQKGGKTPLSIGNEGVPTDRQTHQQTHQQTQKTSNSIEEATFLLDSLDTLKKEIRLKFKKLTDQEFLVFSTIYQFNLEFGFTDYRSISVKLNLTESSIRDYVGKIIKKGLPIEKKKINNKTINLIISENLRKIASLNTITILRDL